MASTTPLPALLKSLNIGVAPVTAANGSNKEAAASNSHSAPTLGLTDQLHLLSAHIDTLEKSVQASVSSAVGKETIKSQGQRSFDVQKRIKEVQIRVQQLEVNDEGKDVGGSAVLECLAQFISEQKEVQKMKRMHHVTTVVRDAVLALERLESRLQKGQLDAQGLAQSISEADSKASLLGIRGTEGNGKGSADAEEYRWIASTSSTPPLAIQELGSRLTRAKDGVQQLLFNCWNECVQIETESTSMRLCIRLKAQSCDISLKQVMNTLQSRLELQELLEKLAYDIVELILVPMLTTKLIWRYDDQSPAGWKIRRDDNGKIPNDTVRALVRLLDFTHEQMLQVAPESPQALFTISKIIVPKLMPLLLKYFKSSLPSRLEKPIASNTIPKLEDVAKVAKEVLDALINNDFLQRDLRDEADELTDWTRNTNKHYMKGLGTQLRLKARDLLLREAGGGWQAVNVEFDVEEKMPIAEQGDSSEAETKGKSIAPKFDEQRANETMSHWDAESTQPVQSQQQQQQPIRSQSLSRQGRQKKSALGGKRVVKPADELGSGPLPESADEVSWGFDDEVTTDELNIASETTIAAPTKAPYDALMEALDQDEDVDEDAWGLTEEEKIEIAAKRASMRGGDMAAAFQAYQASQGKEKSNLQQIQDTEEGENDEDDAWGLSAQEAFHEVEAGKSSGSGEKLSDTTTDPWEEISATKSNTAASISSVERIGNTLEVEQSGTLSAKNVVPASATIKDALSSTTIPLAAEEMPANVERSQRDEPQATLPVTAPSPLAFAKSRESCVISKRSVSLIEVIKEVFNDIEAIIEEDMGDILKTSYLVNALNDILDMHRGLLPVGHADTLSSVPSLAMQFANDCLYIGRELKEMRKRWDAIQSRLPMEEKLDFDLQAELTISLGKRSYDGQLFLQHKMLLDCLQDAQGFTGTYEEHRFIACQRSIKQVELILKQLQSAWRPVLTKSSYLAAMGRLVEVIIRKLMLDIESIEDISEVESEKLASIIKQIGELEYLFRDDDQSAEESVVTLFVPSWFKVSYLSEILTGSLVDIEFLYFEAGALVDYSKAEVVSLVRSLFADTPKRARIIDRIQSS